jgi:hypothetical protein
MRREVWPEEYVPPSPGHSLTHCGNSNCNPCRSLHANERARAGQKPWKKSKEWVDDNEYTEEERLTNLRIEGARRRGMRR